MVSEVPMPGRINSWFKLAYDVLVTSHCQGLYNTLISCEALFPVSAALKSRHRKTIQDASIWIK